MGAAQASPIGQGVIDAVLRHLGVRDRCELVSIRPFYRAQFPDFQLDVPTGRDAFIDAHRQHFPGEGDGIRELTELCAQLYSDYVQFPIDPRLWQWPLVPMRHPRLFRYVNATLGEVLDRHLSDPRLKAAYATLWPYVGLPPSRISFLTWATMMASYIEEGAFYCIGGFQRLVDAFVQALANHGGQLALASRVTRIRVENGRVRGAVLENGQVLDAPVVISNIDARITFGELLEPGQVPGRFLRKLSHMEPSVSVVSLYLATDLDVRALGVAQETMRYMLPDHEQIFRGAAPNRLTALNVTIPSVADKSLAPTGEHVCVLSGFPGVKAGELSGEARARFAVMLLDAAENVLPGLRNHITFVEGAAPSVAEKFPGRLLGPIYGWAATPKNAGARRLSNQTAISGLYLVGHWTQPGHGIWSVVASGVRVARLVLAQRTSEGLIPLHL
jgi:prolycopene isomerase